jgi:hypothetical protein
MTAEVRRVLNQCKALGIILEPTPDGEHLDLHYQAPPPENLRQLLKAHKQEIISLLKPQKPLWHAQKVAEAVRKEGVCLFWSDLFQEVIAFIREESFRSKVPGNIVVYTDAELSELFGGNRSPKALRLIYEAKRHGGIVNERTDSDN